MAKRRARITGWGMKVPQKVLTNHDLERMVDTSDQWITERTGIKERRIAEEGDTTFTMGYAAAREALARAGIPGSEIDLTIVGTVSPDYDFPATACLIQDAVGARGGAFDLEAGCSSFVYGLAVAAAFIEAGAASNVLLVGAEVLSRVVNYKDRNTCVIFGDGAGAVVLGRSEDDRGIRSSTLGSNGAGGPMLCLPAGGSRHPASHSTVDEGMHYLYMHGNEIFKEAVQCMTAATERVLSEAGLTSETLDLFVPHQANQRIINNVGKRLGIDGDRVFVNVDRYGNTSSASVPIALYEAAESGRLKPGDTVAVAAFGTGLTWGAAALDWVP